MSTMTTADAQCMTNELSTVLRSQFAQMHTWLDGTMQDVSADCAHWQPSGRVVPVGAHYAHHVLGAEDFMLNVLIRGDQPLAMGAWQGRTGISEMPPMGAWDEWARRVQIDLPALRAYAQAVYANTDAYLAGMTMDEWNRQLDMSAVGMEGQQPVSFWLTNILLDGALHCGEISAVKGLQGLQGYPF
jgi:hypothetical protein